jgi:hypothetical protein
MKSIWIVQSRDAVESKWPLGGLDDANIAHLEENMAAANIQLSPEEWKKIEGADYGRDKCGCNSGALLRTGSIKSEDRPQLFPLTDRDCQEVLHYCEKWARLHPSDAVHARPRREIRKWGEETRGDNFKSLRPNP